MALSSYLNSRAASRPSSTLSTALHYQLLCQTLPPTLNTGSAEESWSLHNTAKHGSPGPDFMPAHLPTVNFYSLDISQFEAQHGFHNYISLVLNHIKLITRKIQVTYLNSIH